MYPKAALGTHALLGSIFFLFHAVSGENRPKQYPVGVGPLTALIWKILGPPLTLTDLGREPGSPADLFFMDSMGF